MKKYFPILQWIQGYNKDLLGGDLSAGLTVGIMLIPQGMAYAMLAGLPPIYGLYASTIPLLIYAIFGTSRQLAVGPVAMVSLLVASGVGAIAELGSDQFIGLAIALALLVGAIQFLLGAFRLGFLVNFLSHPVIAGFTSAAALIIGFSQLKHLLGLDIPRGKVHETIIHVFQQFNDIDLITFLIGAGSIATILILKQINKRIPSPLIVVILGVALVSILGLDERGVAIIKDVPSGFPSFILPSFSGESFQLLLPIALTISLVSYMESYAVAKAIQNKHKTYHVDANQELIALGAANIVGSFFQAFPTTGGFSRTAVNDQAGAKTGVAAIISALVVVATLLFLTSYFYFLPKAILAAIILVAVLGLIDIKEAKYLWKTDRLDFVGFSLTAVSTLALGVENGIAIGVIYSLLLVIYKVSYPHIAELGRVPDTSSYRNVLRFEELETHDHIMILRFDAQLFFANASTLKSYILDEVGERKEMRHLILDASAMNDLDSSAVHMLHDLKVLLLERGVQLHLANVMGPVRDKMHKTKLFEHIGKENFHLKVHQAVKSILGRDQDKFSEYATQYQEL